MRERALAERLHDARDLLLRECRGRCPSRSRYCPPVPVRPTLQRDGAAARGELQGVRHQVEADLANGALVGPELRQVASKLSTILQALALGAQPQQAVAVLDDLGEVDRLLVQLVAAGLDAGEVEDLVDEMEQVLAALVDVAGIFLVGRVLCGPSISHSITSEKPRMALSGVRSSWLMVARKRDLAMLAASARARASSEIDFASSSSAISASFSARNSSMASAVELSPLARKMK